MMRVLYSVPVADGLNPFLETLTGALRQYDRTIEFGFGKKNLWSDDVYRYDILHIMWPEFLADEEHSAIELENHLKSVKEKGIRIVSTCHNIEPHYCNNHNKREAINVCYGLSDVIHHLGLFSCDYLRMLYPNIKHIIIPHHIYDNLYNKFYTKNEACNFLRISPNSRYILSLGAIRDIEEIELLEYVAKNLKKGVKLIVPSLILNIGKRSEVGIRLKYYFDKYFKFHNRLISNLGVISNEEIPYYLSLSEISLIQRIKILNSGNVPLGMQGGNVIIGPEIGNVGLILKETGNFTFNDKEEIPLLIEAAIEAANQGKGNNNKQFALSHWSSSIIAKKVYESYQSILV